MEITFILVLAFLGPMISEAGGDRKCDLTRDIPRIQILCKEQNDLLLKYQSDRNNKKLCRQVILVLKCVADNITRCYDKFHEINELYFQSPTFCKLTAKHIREIQAIRNSKKRAKKPTTPTPPSVTTDSSSENGTSATVASKDKKNETVISSQSDRKKGDGPGPSSSTKGDRGEAEATFPSTKKSDEKDSDQGYRVSKGDKNVGSRGSSEGQTGSKRGDGNSSSSPVAQTVLVTLMLMLSLTTTFSLPHLA